MGSGNSKKKQTAPDDGRVRYRDLVTKGKVTEHYRPGRRLGAGNMATVYLYSRLRDNKAFAAKIVEKESLSNQEEFTNELEILAHLRGHSHILELEDVFEDKKKYYLITDLVAGGELFDPNL